MEDTETFKEPASSDLSVSAGYTKFRRGDRVKALTRQDGYFLGKFIGIDSDGVVTMEDVNGVQFTAWECNVYSV